MIAYLMIGMYILIEDFDQALASNARESYLDADITPMTYFNESHHSRDGSSAGS